MTEQEKRDFFDFERKCQKILDDYYKSRGHTVDRSKACKGFDCILDGTWKVEEKIRDREYNDILLEIIQDMETNNPGWFNETECDYLHYVFMKGENISRFIRFKWDKFRNWYIQDYLTIHSQNHCVVSARGWGVTVNLSIPINDIPNYLFFDDRPDCTDILF